jgi:hypothetical protein
MRRSEFIGLFGGLVLFIFLSILLHMMEVPHLGQWEIVIQALAWVMILAGAVYLTRRWLAPTLIAAAGFLMIAGERWERILLEQGSDTSVVHGMILTVVLDGVILILLLAGLILMFRGGLRRFFPPQGGV